MGIKGQYMDKHFCTYTWYDDHTFKISLINLTIKSTENGTQQLLMKPQLTNFIDFLSIFLIDLLIHVILMNKLYNGTNNYRNCFQQEKH